MKNNIKTFISIVCCFLAGIYIAQAQQPIGDEKPAIAVIGSVGKQSIKLRWAPNSPSVWKYANQYGYYIERQTVTRGEEILNPREIVRLTDAPILPKPMMEWESFANENDLAAIAAQALYGTDFEVEMNEGTNGMMSIINQAQMFEQRFTFALYAADLDFEVARYSGLSYVDSSVKENETYLYKIIPAIPSEKMIVDFGGVFLGLRDYKELPKPVELAAIFKDKHAMLTWNYRLLESEYNSYLLERSADAGLSFQQISEEPITAMTNIEEQNTSRIVYVDSLPQNNKEYQYRVKGISPFGEVGPPSDIVSGKGTKGLYYNPAILNASISEDQKSATIQWEYPEEGMESLSHFEILRANHVKGNFIPIETNLNKNTRQIRVHDLLSINYYSIAAIGLDGTKRVSFPRMVQPDDAIPPADPRNLEGTIDSTGIVRLQWLRNTESDFLGYRVFRANLEGEEFTQITFDPIKENAIVDTIPIKTLVKRIYYKVQAFDKRYNPSGFSEVLMLKRPDIIPPTPPVFSKFKVEEGKVYLEWIPSASEDAVKTIVYRKAQGTDEDWGLVADQNIETNAFTDTTIADGASYLYTMLTMDDSGLESEPITPITIRTLDQVQKPEISRFNATPEREQQFITLNWSYNESSVSEIVLYKGKEDEKPTLFKVFENGEQRFVDQELQINTNYTYLLQAVYLSGSRSPLKKVTIKY